MADSFSSFLWQGSVPPTVASQVDQTSAMPAWYQAYTQALMNAADVIASEPFQPYGGPRIAGFSPTQQMAFDLARQRAFGWEPTLAQSGAALARGAQPFSQEQLGQYLTPYVEGVVDEISRQGWREFDRNVADRLRSEFVGSGQFGSERHMQKFNEAIADTQREILGQSALARQRAFEAAMGDYGRWADRALTAGQKLGSLAEMAQQLDTRTIAGLEAIGAKEQALEQANLDLAYKDFLEQRDYPRQNIAFLSSVLRGLQVPTSHTRTDVAPYTGYLGPSGLATLAGLWALGKGMG